MKGENNMGKALVLKNVDFSDVALDQISFEEDKPCTAISLDKNAITVNNAEGTSQITAALTPADTTDSLTWTSSNTNVASVDSSGLVTVHGIGTATITATCGEQTATVTVTQTTIKGQFGTKIAEGYAVGQDSDVLKIGAQTGMNAIGQDYNANHNDLQIRYGYAFGSVELIRVPYGATKACIATSNNVDIDISYGFIADTTDIITKSDKQFPAFVSQTTWVNTGTGLTVEYGQCVVFSATSEQLPTLDYVYFK